MQAVITKQAVIDSMRNVAAENEEKNRIEEENNKQAVASSNVVQRKLRRQHQQRKNGIMLQKEPLLEQEQVPLRVQLLVKDDRAKGALVGSLVGGGVGVGTGLVADGVKKKKNRGN